MPQVKHYIRAKVRWDKIPDEVVISYEKAISLLEDNYNEGPWLQQQKIKLYNHHFGPFGYTKDFN